MRRPRLAGARFLVAILAVLPACADQPTTGAPDEPTTPLPPPDLRSKYLDVYLDDEGPSICPPTLERLDAEVERIAAALGVTTPDPEAERIVFYFGDWAVKERCDIEQEVGEFKSGGCTDYDGEWVAAQRGAESHELVHYLRVREETVGPPYWEEGLATYLGSFRPYRDHIVRPTTSGSLSPALWLRSSFPPATIDEYSEAAHFVAFVAATHGSDELRTLSTTLAYADPDTAFLQILGSSLDEVEAQWKTEADDSYLLDAACESTIMVGEAPTVVRGEIGCDVPGVIGPGPDSTTTDFYRGPLHCFQTPPDSILTVTARGSDDRGFAVVSARSSDACPTYDSSLSNHVEAGTEDDMLTHGCEWSITYVSSLEGDAYEIELVLQ